MKKSSWKQKTSARILTTARVRRAIGEHGARAVGIVGFSGSFQRNANKNAESACRCALRTLFLNAIENAQPDPIWCVSGATDSGVPGIAYAIASELNCINVGITAEAAQAYPIANLQYLTVVGKRFGDESSAFLSVCSELWVLGGGNQSKKECLMANELGIPMTVIQGLGGIADEFSPETINATFLNIDSLQEGDR